MERRYGKARPAAGCSSAGGSACLAALSGNIGAAPPPLAASWTHAPSPPPFPLGTPLQTAVEGSSAAAHAITSNASCNSAATPSPLPPPQLGQSRWLYVVLWMAKHGNGLVPPKNIIAAAKRLRVTCVQQLLLPPLL